MTDNCVLSIDIGTRNLGYAILSWAGEYPTIKHINIDFDILTIDDGSKKDIVVKRINILKEFLHSKMELYNIKHIIIERQVTTNVVAMCLMYTIATFGIDNDIDIVIFDPKQKFSILGVQYTSIKKEHKIQSIMYARNLIHNQFHDKLSKFTSYLKQDDISDAINQGILWMINQKIIVTSIDSVRQLMLSPKKLTQKTSNTENIDTKTI